MSWHNVNIKLVLTIFFLFSITNSLISQSTFFNGAQYYLNKQVINNQGWPEFHPYIDSIRFDSLKNNREYFTYFNSDSHTFSKLYVENRKVFFKITDTGFTMIMDFNLNKGDSMNFYTYQGNSVKLESKIRIDSVENSYIFGKPSKILYLKYNGYKYFNFIEQMGCARCGLPYWKNFFAKTSINCVGMCFQDSGVKWQEDFGGDPGYIRRNLTCNDLRILLDARQPIKSNVVQISPNPADNILTVNAEYDLHVVHIKDLTGKVVVEKQLIGTSQTIDISQLLPGTYVASFQNTVTGITNILIYKR